MSLPQTKILAGLVSAALVSVAGLALFCAPQTIGFNEVKVRHVALGLPGHEAIGVFTSKENDSATPAVSLETTGGLTSDPQEYESTEVTDDGRVIERAPLTEVETVPLGGWNPDEKLAISAIASGTTDVLSQLPVGIAVTPPRAMSLEELLNANQADRHITYLPPASPEALAGAPKGQIELSAPDYLDYDDENKSVYGRNVTARYGPYTLRADQMLIDVRTKEVQAYGNVKLTTDRDYIEAGSMWVNTENFQGVAYNARGRSGTFYFLSDNPVCGDGHTTFRQLSKDEAYFKNASFTTCDFPVPHYRIQARQFDILYNDRIFASNVVIYVREHAVMWLPYLTKAITEKNPWGFTVGTDGTLGAYVRVWYDYYHSCYSPSDVDDNLMVKTESGRARLHYDYYSMRGFGKGLDYKYYFDRGRQRGAISLYEINDKDWNVQNTPNQDRYKIDWWHRATLADNVSWMIDVNYPSDPDIYYDIFDRFASRNDDKQRRMFDRHAGTGLEYTVDDFFAGLHVELRDRIGRDRVSNFQDPHDSDYDFDRKFNNEQQMFVPNLNYPLGGQYTFNGWYTNPASVDDNLDNGLSPKRWGRVTERMPELNLSSNRERLWCLPLWYHLDLNVFNNLDKGLNTVGTRDDSFVHGFDLYQSITNLLKFGDRYTLLTKIGLGIGSAQREDDSYNLNFPDGSKFPFVYDGQVIPGYNHAEGLTFIDRDTFLIGTRRMSLKDVDPFFGYGDIDSRFNARITDSMTAWVRYRYRGGNGNSLGQFYESIGSRYTRDDLYPFRNRENWLEAGITQNFLIPRMNWTASVGKNLQTQDDIYANELLQYANVGAAWTNYYNTFSVNAGLGLQERQMRDPTDPNQYQTNSMTYYITSAYQPVNRRFWTRLNAFFIQNMDSDPLGSVDERNVATQNETVADWTIGRKVGSKYLVEYKARLWSSSNNTNENWLRIQRDCHDIIAGVQFGMKANKLSNNQEVAQDNFQFQFNLKFKACYEGLTPVPRTTDLFSARKIGAYETGE